MIAAYEGVAERQLAEKDKRIEQLELAVVKATLAVFEEREACARIAESWFGVADEAAQDIASRIRARGKTS